MQLLCVWCALVNHMSMTDSCFIDDTQQNTTCHTWLMLPRHQAAVAAVSVGLSHAPAPTSTLQDSKVLLFAWLATRWDAFSRCRMSGLLGGHMLAVFV